MRAEAVPGSFCALLAVLLLSVFEPALGRDKDVEDWVAGDLADYVGRQLARMPRFRDSTVRFVVLEGDRPATATNRLALELRDRLEREVVERDGVRIAWRPDSGTQSRLPSTGADCEAGRADLLVGIELLQSSADEALVSVRAMDIVEQRWVTGFNHEWRGRLNRRQRRAADEDAVDRGFIGQRGLPYGQNETDLMARHLARHLRCALMRQVSGEYVLGDAGDEGDGADPVLDLVRNQMTGLSSLSLVARDTGANAELQSQLHTVDRSLQQYWVTLTPTDAASGLEPVSTSVYVSTPIEDRPRLAAEDPEVHLGTPAAGILGGLGLVTLDGSPACGGLRPSAYGDSATARRGQCAALSIAARQDALVFVLNHQLQRGLVRIGDGRCASRPVPRVARADARLLVTVPQDAMRADWQSTDVWQPEPDGDTYYAVAASNGKAARAIAAHVGRLPQRCGESIRPGYRGESLRRWLAGLEREMDRFPGLVDWRALRVRQVF